MGAQFSDVVALVLVVLIVYILVRPSSKAAELVKAFADTVIAVLRSATDLAREGV